MSETTRRRALVLGTALCVHAGIVHADDALPDPTRPPTLPVAPEIVKQAESAAPLVLRAIVVSEGRRTAIVNGERVGVGDLVQAARVLSIDRDRVVLVRDESRVELVLIEDVKRRRPAPAPPAIESTPPTEGPMPASIDPAGSTTGPEGNPS